MSPVRIWSPAPSVFAVGKAAISGVDALQNGMSRLFGRSFFTKKQDKKTDYKMFYVYILKSVNFPENFYIGFTNDLKQRFHDHNSGYSTHTKKFAPWVLKNYIAFNDEQKAKDFETYLKTHSGRKFCKNHF